MTVKKIRRAKVILRTGLSYTYAGRKYLKDVPVFVEGRLVEEFLNNGYFRVVELDPIIIKKDDESEKLADEIPVKKKKLMKKKKAVKRKALK